MIEAVMKALDEAYEKGLEDPAHPISEGIRMGARYVAIVIGQNTEDPEAKDRLLTWALGKRVIHDIR